MKDMIQRMTDIESGKSVKKLNESAVTECGMPAPMPNEPVGNPVTMSISLNASGKEHVADLIAMMKNAGLQDAQPVSIGMMPMRADMEKFRDIVDGPMIPGEGADNTPKEEYMDTDEMLSGGDDLHHEKNPADIRVKDPSIAGDIEEWNNTPDGSDGEERYADHNTMLKDLSGGINREKKMFKKAQDGDNPMAVETIKQRLVKALAEKKAKPDFLDMDKDGNKKEPMKKAVADKKKNPFDKKKVDEKFDPLKHVKDPTPGEKKAAKDVKRSSYKDRAAMLKSAEKDGRLKEGSTGDYSAKKARAGKDIGKPGKNFAKIAKSAEKGGAKSGEAVAGAVLKKLRKG